MVWLSSPQLQTKQKFVPSIAYLTKRHLPFGLGARNAVLTHSVFPLYLWMHHRSSNPLTFSADTRWRIPIVPLSFTAMGDKGCQCDST